MPDLLDRIRAEIGERLEASRAAAEQMRRLEDALRALEGVPSAGVQGRGAARTQRAPSGGRRAPRGANRQAVLTAVTERPGASAGEIATACGVAQNAVHAQLRRLVVDAVLVKRELPSGRSGYALAPADEANAGDKPTPDEPVDTAKTRPPGTYAGEY